jgi:alginate O-acetyltransferase complex protein AlgI
MTEWLFAPAKMSAGVIVVWFVARLLLPEYPMLAGWTGMIGVVFMLHFGSFHLLSLLWRRAGIKATPVMQNPLLATSLTDFWGGRWNTAFNELAFRFTYRPLRRLTTQVIATIMVFALSGLLHDLIISLPARGGYGLPTLYFLIQGFGTIIERSRFGHAIGLGRGARGWLFTLFVTVTPAFWLFHPPFITHVILPMLAAIGAT